MINQYALAKAKMAFILTEQGINRDINKGLKIKADPLQSAIEEYLGIMQNNTCKSA